MKKISSLLLFTAALCSSSSLFAAPLSCKNLNGNWGGSLESLSPSVSLSLDVDSQNQADGEINFTTSDGSTGFGGLTGSCIQNQDGSLSMNLARHGFGIDSTLSAQLIDAHTLKINSFDYSIYGGIYHEQGHGSGTLKK